MWQVINCFIEEKMIIFNLSVPSLGTPHETKMVMPKKNQNCRILLKKINWTRKKNKKGHLNASMPPRLQLHYCISIFCSNGFFPPKKWK